MTTTITKMAVVNGWRFQAEDGEAVWAIRENQWSHQWAVMQGCRANGPWTRICYRRTLDEAEALARTILGAI